MKLYALKIAYTIFKGLKVHFVGFSQLNAHFLPPFFQARISTPLMLTFTLPCLFCVK